MREYQDIRIEKVKRGEMYYVKSNIINNGSLQQKSRLYVVTSNDVGNFHSNIFLALPLTTKPKKMHLPTHCTIYSAPEQSMVLAEQITVLDQNDIIGDCVGVCTENEMEDIEKCMIVSLGIKCNVKVGNKIIDSYLEQLEKQLAENNLIFNTDGYLTKREIIRIPVIEKASLENGDNEKVHILEKENERLKAEVQIYKEMLDKFMGTYMK